MFLFHSFFLIFFWVFFLVVTVFFSCTGILISLFGKEKGWVKKNIRIWSKLVCRAARIKIKTIGFENVEESAKIYIANHQSWFDIFVLTSVLPANFNWVSKKEVFRVPFVGWVMACAGYISIDRENRLKAYQYLEKAVEKINKGESIAIFPEGTRSVDGQVGKFKKGVLHLMAKTKVAIVPITIDGSYKVMRKNSFSINPGEIRVVMDKPMEVGKNENNEELLTRTREIIINNLNLKERK